MPTAAVYTYVHAVKTNCSDRFDLRVDCLQFARMVVAAAAVVVVRLRYPVLRRTASLHNCFNIIICHPDDYLSARTPNLEESRPVCDSRTQHCLGVPTIRSVYTRTHTNSLLQTQIYTQVAGRVRLLFGLYYYYIIELELHSSDLRTKLHDNNNISYRLSRS